MKPSLKPLSLKLAALLISGILHLDAFSAIKVTSLGGTVSADGKPLKLRSEVKIGQKIVAQGKKSFVTLSFDGESHVRLRNGEMIVQEASKKKTLLGLLKGTLFNFVKPLAKDQKFEIKTKSVSMGVRGTKFMAMSGDDDYICVCEGEVWAKEEKRKPIWSVKAGEDLKISRDPKKAHGVVKATAGMMSMASSEFEDMGFPVEMPTSHKN